MNIITLKNAACVKRKSKEARGVTGFSETSIASNMAKQNRESIPERLTNYLLGHIIFSIE